MEHHVGMERGENKVACEGRFNRDFSGLQVAHFSDHNDVRVLAKEASQSS